MGTPRTPLLRQKHFVRRGGLTTLSGVGLAFNCEIGHDDRAMEVEFGRTLEERDTFIERFASRRPTRCVLNPRIPSAANLMAMFKQAQRGLPREQINVGFGLPATYERGWTLFPDDGGVSEVQTIVMVAFDAKKPVGYVGMEVSLFRSNDPTEAALFLAPHLIYVSPARRGEGFGIDLSVACGYFATDLVKALYAAAPIGTTISSNVVADYESKGGEAFASHLVRCLEFAHEMLCDMGERSGLIIGPVELDAGY